jgi:hypothetical protein
MASPSPSVEELLQQLILGQQRTTERLDAVVGQSTNTNTRLDEVLKRVEDIELAQSIALYRSSAPQEGSHPQEM